MHSELRSHTMAIPAIFFYHLNYRLPPGEDNLQDSDHDDTTTPANRALLDAFVAGTPRDPEGVPPTPSPFLGPHSPRSVEDNRGTPLRGGRRGLSLPNSSGMVPCSPNGGEGGTPPSSPPFGSPLDSPPAQFEGEHSMQDPSASSGRVRSSSVGRSEPSSGRVRSRGALVGRSEPETNLKPCTFFPTLLFPPPHHHTTHHIFHILVPQYSSTTCSTC